MNLITGTVYVVGDNIDTDQIIPAQYLNLVPTIPAELKKLGSYALSGLPDSYSRFVPEGKMTSPYTIIIAGRNFGCGSSREHAPVSLGAAGTKVVVAESFARIFFRNCIAAGALYPVECHSRLCEVLKTGAQVRIDFEKNLITATATKKSYPLLDLGAAREVIDHGGLFKYARDTGMLKS